MIDGTRLDHLRAHSTQRKGHDSIIISLLQIAICWYQKNKKKKKISQQPEMYEVEAVRMWKQLLFELSLFPPALFFCFYQVFYDRTRR
jgi:hypothetical protein